MFVLRFAARREWVGLEFGFVLCCVVVFACVFAVREVRHFMKFLKMSGIS